MLESLVTSEITRHNAATYQIHFITDLMHVYDESDMLYENLGANINKGEFFHDATSWKIVKQMKKTNKNLSKKVKKKTLHKNKEMFY